MANLKNITISNTSHVEINSNLPLSPQEGMIRKTPEGQLEFYDGIAWRRPNSSLYEKCSLVGKSGGGAQYVKIEQPAAFRDVYDTFGVRAAMNAAGDRIVIGASNDEASGYSNNGAAYVFTLTNGVWDSGVKIEQPAAFRNDYDYFGVSVAMNAAGDKMVIGAFYDEASGYGANGAAYVFTLTNGVWDSGVKIEQPAASRENNDSFGGSVAMNAAGDRIVIGASSDEASGYGANGAAYVFTLTNGVWDSGVKIEQPAAFRENNDSFGGSVTINAAGDRIAIGAFNDEASGLTDNGAAYVFTLTNGVWDSGVKIEQPAAFRNNGDQFGYSIAMNAAGDRIAVSATKDESTPTTDNGAVYIFTSVNDTWDSGVKIEQLAAFRSNGDWFGYPVVMNAAGDRIVIGAFADEASGFTDNGAAYVFTLTNGVWDSGVKIEQPAAFRNNYDYFGGSVAMNAAGDRIVIGASNDEASASTDNGSAYIFDFANNTSYRYTPEYIPALLIQAESSGLNAPYTNYRNQRIVIEGTEVLNTSTGRGCGLSRLRWNGTKWEFLGFTQYDTFASSANATSFSNALLAMAHGDLAVITTFDEPSANSGIFIPTISSVFGVNLPTPLYRGAFLLIGFAYAREGKLGESLLSGPIVSAFHNFEDVTLANLYATVYSLR